MATRKGLGQANILRTNNNTSTGYGVVYADEVSGHRTVANLTALYALHDWQLSASGDNTDNDAIGQLWYVVDADGKNSGAFYQLKDWSKRKEAAGWSEFKGTGASTAAAVTFDNAASGMTAVTAQGAIDELAAKKFDKASILQELGNAEDKVMSQKATSTELNKKFDKNSIAQEPGDSEELVMSQKATTEIVRGIKDGMSASEYPAIRIEDFSVGVTETGSDRTAKVLGKFNAWLNAVDFSLSGKHIGHCIVGLDGCNGDVYNYVLSNNKKGVQVLMGGYGIKSDGTIESYDGYDVLYRIKRANWGDWKKFVDDTTEQHFFNYDENFGNITSKIELSKRYTNYLIGYYNTKNSQYELYRYTRTELSDAYWNNNMYWNIIPCKSFELFVQMYKDIYYNQSFNCNNLRRIQQDEVMNLLDTSISLGVGIDNKGVIQKGDVKEASDHIVQGPIYVKQLDNVVIYSEDRTVPNNKPIIYKYDEVGNFISKIDVTTFPFIVDVSDCTYIFVKSYRIINLQVVPGTEPFPASSKLWAFRSLYSEGVILPYNLYYLDNLLLPYYVENISINKGVELYGSFVLNIINREELFIPKGEGVININVGYGYRDAGPVMQTQVKKARLSTANKSPKILCIGDSFTEIGTWQITLKDNLENLGINAKFIGAMHSVNTVLNKVGISENQTGGRLRANFIDAVAGKCYLVKVSGLSEKTMPINFNRYVTYTSNGYTWTVWGYNLSEEGDGTMRLYCADAAASLSETGILTKKSGTGDASINYTNATEVNKNPFYNPSEQKFDPQYYFNAWGFDKPDVVCLMFGANDMTRSAFNKTFWKDVKDFIDAWKNVLPDTKFVIGSSKLYMSYANNWGASDKRSLKYNFAYLSLLYKDSEDIYICPTWANIDPKNGFDVTETVASKRFPDVKFKTNSNVHPNVGGMQQIGDAMTPYVIDALN